jgi:hypothetical protein
LLLSQECIRETEIDGKKAEMWFRRPGREKPEPAKEYKMGSGFLISTTDSLFLVTASHVAASMTTSAQVVMKATDGRSLPMALAALIGGNKTSWVTHPEADIAVHKLRPDSKKWFITSGARFLPDRILETQKKAPARTKVLTLFGFPLALGSSELFSPLSRSSYPASDLLKLPRFDNKRISSFFLLEDPSIEGYSGALVVDFGVFEHGGIKSVESATKIVGVVHGTISDPTGGKLAAIIPSYFIIDTIKQAR